MVSPSQSHEPTKRSYYNVSSTTCFSLVSLSSTIFPRIIFSLSRFFRIFELFFAEAQQATQVGIKIDDIFFAKLIKLKQVVELTLNYLSQLIINLHSAFTVLPPFFLYLTIGSQKEERRIIGGTQELPKPYPTTNNQQLSLFFCKTIADCQTLLVIL